MYSEKKNSLGTFFVLLLFWGSGGHKSTFFSGKVGNPHGPPAPPFPPFPAPKIFTSPGNQKVHLRVPGGSKKNFLVWSNMVRYGHNKVPGRLKTLFGALNDVLGPVLGGPKCPKRVPMGRVPKGPKSRLLGQKINFFPGSN